MEFINDIFSHFNMYYAGLISPNVCKSRRWVRKKLKHQIARGVRHFSAKYYWDLLIFLQVTIDNVGDVFSGFLFISTHISLDLISLGSAEAYTGWGGKLNDHLMASYVRNIRTKNYQNPIIAFKVTVENVGDFFW